MKPLQKRQSEYLGESTSDRLDEWNFLEAVATGLAGADIESAEYCWPVGSPWWCAEVVLCRLPGLGTGRADGHGPGIGLARLARWCAYRSTPMSACPASRAIFRAELPSTSTMLESHSAWFRRSRTMSACPCSAAHIRAVLPSSSCRFTAAPASRSSWDMSLRPCDTASINAV